MTTTADRRLSGFFSAGLSPVEGKAHVDREKGIIYGVSAMQAVTAKGHGVAADATSLKQIVDLGNADPNGIKVRFRHPEKDGDALGTVVGRLKAFRVVGDKAIADLHLSRSAALSPAGDLRSYLMAFAEEDPAAFGMSAVFKFDAVWRLPTGEVPAFRIVDGEPRMIERPSGALNAVPVVRPSVLAAVDIVDDPAANRDGLFSAAPFTAGNSPANSPKGNHMDKEALKAFKAKHPDHAGLIVDMFADGKTEVEMMAAIKDVDLANANERAKVLAADLKSKEDAHVISLKAKDDAHQAALAAKDAELAALKTKAEKDQKLLALATGGGKDPGADHQGAKLSAEEKLKAEWEGLSSDQQMGFCNDFAGFKAWKANAHRDRAAAAEAKSETTAAKKEA